MSSTFDTVADVLNEMDGNPKAEKPQPVGRFEPATLPDTPPLPEPGIYFGMPEDQYHALPALGSHGVKDVAASPMLFWARCTWLSERRRKEEAKRKAEERVFQTIGRAYHCRLLEGAEAYAERYAVELSPEECEGALESTDQIKAAIVAADEKPVAKVPDQLPDGQAYMRAARKEDWIAQLLDIDPSARILGALRDQHRQANEGKAFIPSDAHEQIEIAARMIELDPEIRHAFTGGYPEVTLIWHCKETGVPMKARVDYLKLKAAVDLKSIGNERGRSMEQAIRWAIAGYHYNIQPSVYLEGIAAVKGLVRKHGHEVVHVLDGDPEDDISEQCIWAMKWANNSAEPQWWWCFQQKGAAPITRLCSYPLQGTTRMLTDDIVRTARRKFRQFSEAFGTDPWVDIAPAFDLADEEIPRGATEI